MPSLSDSQRLVLTTAGERADGALLPLPDGLRARQLMLQGLIKRGLIAERPAQDGDPAFAQGDAKRGIALEITAEGRALIGSADQAAIEPAPAPAAGHAADPDAASKDRPTVRSGTKQALLVKLLRRRDGATSAEIQDATGWQPHTARAAITGLRKKSFAVSRVTRGDGTRAYRLLPQDRDHAEEIA